MRKVILSSIVALALFSTGCLKDNECSAKTVESEDAAMQSFASANSITATKHSTGMYYQIVNPGSGPTPTLTSTLSVKYTGKLTNGTVFDQQTASPVSLTLNQVIPGWKVGLPLIQKGGVIKLIIPSAMGYGCATVGPIPPNSILYFEIELIDVQ